MKGNLVLGNTRLIPACLNGNHSLHFYSELLETHLAAYIVFENNMIGYCQLSEKITIFAL